jgi:transposase
VVAQAILGHVDQITASITILSEQIVARCQCFVVQIEVLREVPGLERTAIEIVLAETGGDTSRFPSAGHLASWAGLCPGNHESAGKRKKVGTPPGNPWLRRVLIESARAAARAKGSYFGAQYAQIARRRGPNKAAVAVAHSLVVVIWHILSTGEHYTDPGREFFERRRDPERETDRLVRQLRQLGYDVDLQPSAA